MLFLLIEKIPFAIDIKIPFALGKKYLLLSSCRVARIQAAQILPEVVQPSDYVKGCVVVKQVGLLDGCLDAGVKDDLVIGDCLLILEILQAIDHIIVDHNAVFVIAHLLPPFSLMGYTATKVRNAPAYASVSAERSVPMNEAVPKIMAKPVRWLLTVVAILPAISAILRPAVDCAFNEIAFISVSFVSARQTKKTAADPLH